jgi:signal transduction histidine kinase
LRALEESVPLELNQLRTDINNVADGLTGALEDLREVARGIHPAILSEAGLMPALRALARRSALHVDLNLNIDRRLPPRIEVACYYVVAEALTNAVKYAQASSVRVEAAIRNDHLQLSVSDDGVGGADPTNGSGLIGLADRVGALNGKITLTSPPRHGTTLHVDIAIADEARNDNIVDRYGYNAQLAQLSA